ncbi:MAG: SHOCT domain-containing protein [Patescibacteria group bacterium]
MNYKIIKVALVMLFFMSIISFQFANNQTVILASDSSTAADEASGKAVWEKLQNKTAECKDLSNDDFDALGDYYMGQMAGSSHQAMDKMMAWRLGEDGERQMYIAMGKRLSGCDPNAAYPDQVAGFWPMMGGGGHLMMGYNWDNMMNGFWGYNWFGVVMMILFWILIIAGIIWLVRYLGGSSNVVGINTGREKSPMDILKERYAKGEINKEEFEEKKKDLV